ncbi:MAG TPA: class I SAM-dependent methyltransferase [Terrimicrobiaceae bacterium]|nr:class I SAM-dependent methyltransferase [Terrimicrobiaceae bacterium]
MISSSEPVSVHQVADHYDELDLYYREIWGEHVHHGLWERGDETPGEAVLHLIKHVARRGEINAGKRVCDVGCGYGGTARVLASEFGAVVSAITISAAQYRYAISQSGEDRSPEYFLGDWASNELPSGVFDAVISIESSEHMQDKPAFFCQAHRVLKTGGRMVVCAWLASENATSACRRHLLEPICREGRLPGMGTEGDYRKWFDDAGFVVETFEDVSARVLKTWSVCLARLLQSLLRRPDYVRFLFASSSRNRVFLVTVARIRLAYALGAMRYGIFTASKP